MYRSEEQPKEVLMWFYECDSCDWISQPFHAHDEIQLRSYCPICFHHVKLKSDYFLY